MFQQIKNKDICIIVLNWINFIIYSLFTIPFECCFSWPTRKRWCVCLHMTSRFYEIDINFRYVVLTFFFMHCSFKFSPFVLFRLSMVLSVLRFTDSDTSFGIFKHLFYIYRLLFLWKVLFLDTPERSVVSVYTRCHDFKKLI